jgi:thioredoxin-like negative regulator of GroEL
LSSKLVAAIPPIKAAGAATTTTVNQLWPWIVGIGLICVTTGGAFVAWLMLSHAKPSAQSNGNPAAAPSSTTAKNASAASKAIQQYERAVSVDPYNADAWFSLAKAQADAHRPEGAISSAQKALDVARSRNRSDLAATIEAWLRSYRATQTGQSAR